MRAARPVASCGAGEAPKAPAGPSDAAVRAAQALAAAGIAPPVALPAAAPPAAPAVVLKPRVNHTLAEDID